MKRRDFIKWSLATGIALSSGSALAGVTKNIMTDKNREEAIVYAGIKDIEGLFSQIHPGDFIIIGGSPGISKVDISYRLGRHFTGIDMKKAVMIYNYEISREKMVLHILTRGLYDEDEDLLLRASSNNLYMNDWVKLTKAAADVSNYPIFIDDSAATIELLCNKTKALNSMQQQGLGIVIVDCLQLINRSKYCKNMEENMFEASKALKCLATEMNIPVVAFSYLRKNAELRADKKPVLADLGIIEQHADMVVFLQNKNIDAGKQLHADRQVKVIVAKNKYGETGTIQLPYHGDYFNLDCS